MFEFHNDNVIKSYRDQMQAKILGSFVSEDKNYKASLIKGMTVSEFDAAYPSDQYEKFSFEAINRYKEDLKKANENDLVKAETQISQAESSLTPVVVQKGVEKKIVYVRKKG